ncbi:MAG: hypothetical protein M1835_000755 [Candelina submexicana]|nr:MAG: hypothetical protein M1835_000755 [Candelina submexicana]
MPFRRVEHYRRRRSLQIPGHNLRFRLAGWRDQHKLLVRRKIRNVFDRLRRASSKHPWRLSQGSFESLSLNIFGGVRSLSGSEIASITGVLPHRVHNKPHPQPELGGAALVAGLTATAPPTLRHHPRFAVNGAYCHASVPRLPATGHAPQPLSQECQNEPLLPELALPRPPSVSARVRRGMGSIQAMGRIPSPSHELCLPEVSTASQSPSASARYHEEHAHRRGSPAHPASLVPGSPVNSDPRIDISNDLNLATDGRANIAEWNSEAGGVQVKACLVPTDEDGRPKPWSKTGERRNALSGPFRRPRGKRTRLPRAPARKDLRAAELRFRNRESYLNKPLPPLSALPQGQYPLLFAARFLDLSNRIERSLLFMLHRTSSRDNGVRRAGPSRRQTDSLAYVPQQIRRSMGNREAENYVQRLFEYNRKSHEPRQRGLFIMHAENELRCGRCSAAEGKEERRRRRSSVHPEIKAQEERNLRGSTGSLVSQLRITGTENGGGRLNSRSRRNGVYVEREGQAQIREAFRLWDKEQIDDWVAGSLE